MNDRDEDDKATETRSLCVYVRQALYSGAVRFRLHVIDIFMHDVLDSLFLHSFCIKFTLAPGSRV